MFNESVLVRSGQGWKALTFLIGSVLSALSLLTGLMLISGKQATLALYLLVLGPGIFIWSLLFACSAIRCPYCGARWVWVAISRSPAADWISLLFAQRVCNACGR
jgi:hypothetical protein